MLGLRHGEGVLTFANGASYSGLWKFDKVTVQTFQFILVQNRLLTCFGWQLLYLLDGNPEPNYDLAYKRFLLP